MARGQKGSSKAVLYFLKARSFSILAGYTCAGAGHEQSHLPSSSFSDWLDHVGLSQVCLPRIISQELLGLGWGFSTGSD
jgi:hypothetical protein